eukprot:TRINITY_DN2022_c2_g1_i2.p1 TRINITY_DN2022_c2_g1~~TRINITY_DN2022_c2_g1_i2.p1  ORF type:complete len:706 (+),score=230.29 TRINITY_DN2022_c2_g1_i2:318-2435(+)
MLNESESFAIQHCQARKNLRREYKEAGRKRKRQSLRGIDRELGDNSYESNMVNCLACGGEEGNNSECEDCLKKRGNDEFRNKNYEESQKFYSLAIKLNQNNATLYSNRSASFCALEKFEEALEDANKCISINSSWPKGFARKGAALLGLKNAKEALEAYLQSAHLEPSETTISSILQIVSGPLFSSQRTERKEKNSLHCGMCHYLFLEPLTLSCGHTFCKSCLVKCGSSKCLECGIVYSKISLPNVNIALNNFLRKNFPAQYEAILIKEGANDAFSKQEYERSLDLYKKSVAKDPHNHIVYNNMAIVSMKLGKEAEALEFEEKSIEVEPNWVKSRISKAKILSELGKLDHSLRSICDAFKIDNENEEANEEFKKVLLGVLREKYQLNPQSSSKELLILLEGNEIKASNGLKEEERKEVEQKASPSEMSCSLCFELLYDPLTPKCGHTFCRICLSRALDHNDACPICRHALPHSLNRQNGDENLTRLLQSLWSDLYEERAESVRKELEEMSTNVPIFVCALLFPQIDLPLHIFEPRYRLMLRRCIESGTRRFGMVTYTDNGFAPYGTIAEIGEVQMLPDGRSLIETTGGQRFKILSHSKKDGYMVGKIEFIEDVPLNAADEEEAASFSESLRTKLIEWMNNLNAASRIRILHAFGSMPLNNPNKLSWWMANALQMMRLPNEKFMEILQTTSLLNRLKVLENLWFSD